MSQLGNALVQLKNSSGLLIPILGPIAYRKGKEWYQLYKSPKRQSKIRSLGLRNFRLLLILIVSAVAYLVIYIPLAKSANPNILQLADARMQTPGEVIKSRITKLYAPEGTEALWTSAALYKMPWGLSRTAKFSTPDDWERLFNRLLTLDGRALYAAYGTAPYLYCDFCRTDVPLTFFTYSLPTIAVPHLIALLVILVVTKGPKKYLSTVQAQQWTTLYSTIVICGMFADAFLLYRYPISPTYFYNKNAPDLSHVFFSFSEYVLYRGVYLATLLSSLAVVLWLGATGRAFDNTFSADGYYRTTQRLAQLLDLDINKLRVATLLHSDVIASNGDFRKVYEQWGANSQEFMKKMEEDENVKEAKSNAKQRKQAILKTVEVEAKALVEKI